MNRGYSTENVERSPDGAGACVLVSCDGGSHYHLYSQLETLCVEWNDDTDKYDANNIVNKEE